MFVSFKTTGRQTMKIKSELSKSLTVPYLRSLSSLPSFVQVLSVVEITKGRQRILQVNSSHSSKSQKTLSLTFVRSFPVVETIKGGQRRLQVQREEQVGERPHHLRPRLDRPRPVSTCFSFPFPEFCFLLSFTHLKQVWQAAKTTGQRY